MTPIQRYLNHLQHDGFVSDPIQKQAVELLQALYDDITHIKWYQRCSALKIWGWQKKEKKRGIYFFGGVGRGKTWLVDMFCESLPGRAKMRIHFHAFMKRIHQELANHSGNKNPLQQIAKRLASQTRVICLDEFYVSDITDAMILARLLDALFVQGVILVTTSNLRPDELYRDGLQRERFLPAIALMKENMQVMQLDSGTDYRLRLLEQEKVFYYPLNKHSEERLQHCFNALVGEPDTVLSDSLIEIEGRKIASVKMGGDIVWFTCEQLCNGPRSQDDYIEIARNFNTVLLSDVPRFDETMDDQMRRFINMIDQFYDHGVKLVMSAAVPLADLYRKGRLLFEFQRTLSRLHEMQSSHYLGSQHIP